MAIGSQFTPLHDRNTRFALPIICPTTGERGISAETLYNRACAAMGQIHDHIGDLVLDNLDYDAINPETHDDEVMCAAIYRWARDVRKLIGARRARFWTYTNKGLVRITLRQGQSLTHVEGSSTDEGYSYTSTTWSFDSDRITREWANEARDCDGPISCGGAMYARLDELAVIVDENCELAFPQWNDCAGTRWQRDAFAEAAGY